MNEETRTFENFFHELYIYIEHNLHIAILQVHENMFLDRKESWNSLPSNCFHPSCEASRVEDGLCARENSSRLLSFRGNMRCACAVLANRYFVGTSGTVKPVFGSRPKKYQNSARKPRNFVSCKKKIISWNENLQDGPCRCIIIVQQRKKFCHFLGVDMASFSN